MTDLARNGSILVAEIKAIHPAAAEATATNGAVPHANGDALNGDATNGEAVFNKGAVPGSATDGGVAAAAIDPSVTTPATHSAFTNGHAPEASTLSAGTGAVAVPHHDEADPSIATGVAAPAAAPAAAAAAAAGEAAAAPGVIQPQTTPIQPIQPSDHAREVSNINTAVPAGVGIAAGAAGASAVSPATGSAVSAGAPHQLNTAAPAEPTTGAPSYPPGTIVPPEAQGLHSVAPGAAAAGGASAIAPIVAHPAPTTVAATEAPKSALSPKEIKKMDKLMKTEAKNEHKSLKRAIKDAASAEKLFRKSRDAETQAMKRHQKSQTNEHKAAKALSKAKAEYEKYAAELAKAVEDLDIKKKHTESTRTGYENAKVHIDELRSQKTVNDQARSRQAAQLHGR
ncbi:DNA binding protein Ncp1 [Sporisorium reilianum SRZ2]|uniref:DNA binding protein Ncp1 n=1 Tax=Sporisorium reilianum (strain SRZ2) TaxID=999809 RepID=E6ZN14_SPORE|nr:DNA binding protein Ncp1 [Sporisorium reilianum SRZ2]